MIKGRVSWALSLLVAGALAGGVKSAGAETLTLAEIESRAQRERPELVERRAGIERANAELEGVRAKGRPTLAARGDLSIAPGGQLVPITYGGDDYFVQGAPAIGQSGALVPRPRYAAVLSGKFTILDFGRTSLGVRAAEAAISAERASLIQAKVELVRAARQAYLAWIEGHQTWQLAQKDAEVTSARTASVRELIREGARPATDATLSAYDEQLAKLREARARRASSLAFESLAASVQSELPPGSVPELEVLEPEAAHAPASDGAAAGAPSSAPSNAPASTPSADARPGATPIATSQQAAEQGLQALDRQRDAALSAAQAADRSAAPVLEAAAEIGVQGQDEQVFPAYRAGISLSVPIFDGGAQSAIADQHRAEARGLEGRRQRLHNQLVAQQHAAESALRAAGEELTMSLALLATAETLLSEAEDHYRSGSDTLERVLSAQRSLVQARREVLTSKLENARARLELAPVQLRD
jgi:outer membrane protein